MEQEWAASSFDYPLVFYYTENDVFMNLRGRRLCVSFVNPRKSRSSRSQMFSKIGALKNLANVTGKRLCWGHYLISCRPEGL